MYLCQSLEKQSKAQAFVVQVLSKKRGERRDSSSGKTQDNSLVLRVPVPPAPPWGTLRLSVGRYLTSMHVPDREAWGRRRCRRQLRAPAHGTATTPGFCPRTPLGCTRDIWALAALRGLPTRVLTGGFWLLLPVIWTEQNVFVKAFICLIK